MKVESYAKKYYEEKKNKCSCGNKKLAKSKRCWKCHSSNKLKGRLSQLKK